MQEGFLMQNLLAQSLPLQLGGQSPELCTVSSVSLNFKYSVSVL